MTCCDRIDRYAEDNRYRRSRRLGRECRGIIECADRGYLTASKVRGQRLQPIILAVRPVIFDHHVVALEIAGLAHALAECSYVERKPIRGRAIEKSNHRH